MTALAKRHACSPAARATARPRYDVTAKDNAYEVRVYLPGVTKDAVKVSVDEGVLTVKAERRLRLPEGWRPLHRESADADYELALRVDAEVDVARVEAVQRDGVLTLTLPKAEAAKPRQIQVG